jgi:outer membrane protein assembly factor BamB
MRRWVILSMAVSVPWLMGGPGTHASAADPTVAAPMTTVVGRDWPLVRGDALATGVADSTLPESFELLWKYSVPKGAFAATPLIVDGMVYIGDLDGAMRAIDLTTGAEKWKFTAQAGFNASAAYRRGRLYLGDSDGVFYCLSAAEGKVQWTFKTEGEIDSSANFFHDNVLFGSQDSTLYCLDAKSGKKVWAFKTADQIRCPPTVVDDRAFVAGCDGKLHIIDVDKGASIDAVDIESPTGCTPAVQGSIVYFGTEAGTFFAIDWKQAKIVWRWLDKVRTDPLRSSAALTPEAVIFGGRDKRVRALDPASGKVLWEQPTRGRVDSSPVVVGQRVFLGSSDGRIYGLDRRTGKSVWQYEAGGEFTGSPAVAAHRLVIASQDGVVYCFGAK